MRVYRKYRTVADLYSSLKDCERDLYLINQHIEKIFEKDGVSVVYAGCTKDTKTRHNGQFKVIEGKKSAIIQAVIDELKS